jgi:hypothetical protein
LREFAGKTTAAVNPVGRTTIFDRFFAVEENELDVHGETRFPRKDTSARRETGSARTAVVRVDELKGVEDFCVVM